MASAWTAAARTDKKRRRSGPGTIRGMPMRAFSAHDNPFHSANGAIATYEENRLKQSVEGDLSVEYRYGSDAAARFQRALQSIPLGKRREASYGQRAVKYSKRGESLYFDAAARFQRARQSIPLGKRREAPYAMWSESINGASIRQSKHVYVGQTRVSTRLNYKGHPDTGFEQANTYYYHGDHLGSAQLVTDPDGQEYEHIEYTPYGELWVEKTRDGIDAIPFRFTGKELDAETGLYYYGARYLDPKTSVWLSADPALGEYVPGAPTDEEARKRNGNLPGMGGVFNTVNLHLYHYAGNNPIKYTDPDGRAPVKGVYNTIGDDSSQAKVSEVIGYRLPKDTILQIVADTSSLSAMKGNLLRDWATASATVSHVSGELEEVLWEAGAQVTLGTVQSIADLSQGNAQSAAELLVTTVDYASEILELNSWRQDSMGEVSRIDSEIDAIDIQINMLDAILFEQHKLEVECE